MTAKRSIGRLGFTLMELLVVIAIIALLVSILMPSLQAAKSLARLAVCQSIMHTLALGNGMYMNDFDGFSVHGRESSNMDEATDPNDWNGYGFLMSPTSLFDDDWGSSDLNNPPSANNSNQTWKNGGQNICNVGQLMWDKYIEETAAAIGCPQADFEKITPMTGSNAGTNPVSYQRVVEIMEVPKMDPGKVYPDGDPNHYWRNDFYTGDNNITVYVSNYVVRGPLFKSGDITTGSRGKPTGEGRPKADSEIGLFADWEQAAWQMWFMGQYFPDDPNWHGTPNWPRRHTGGVVVAYLDGHVSMFNDENRLVTSYPGIATKSNAPAANWDGGVYSGSGDSLYNGAYDFQN